MTSDLTLQRMIDTLSELPDEQFWPAWTALGIAVRAWALAERSKRVVEAVRP